MYSHELLYFIVLSVIILVSQYLPTQLLLLLDNIAIRLCIVLLLLYLITMGPTAGIFGVIAVSMLYLERNRRKVSDAIKKINLLDPQTSYATVKEAGTPQQTVPVAEFDLPQLSETDFLPHSANESSDFEPVAPSINEKAVLSSVYPLHDGTAAADELYEQMGFGHINNVETHQ